MAFRYHLCYCSQPKHEYGIATLTTHRTIETALNCFRLDCGQGRRFDPAIARRGHIVDTTTGVAWWPYLTQGNSIQRSQFQQASIRQD
jgi:hypothetical protein